MPNGSEEPKYPLEPKEITPPDIENDKLVEIAAAAEKRMEAIKKIKRMAMRLTNEHDWVRMKAKGGDKPYLQASGSEKIARLFGISWRFIGDPQRINDEDGHFGYEVRMEFMGSGSKIEVVGTRSSKDEFFTTRYKYNPETKQREIALIPPGELDAGDLLKSAITNTIGNGITRLLGIRNLSWEDLKEAGLDTDKIGIVEYRDKPKSDGGQGEGQKEIQDPSAPATEPQIGAIKKMMPTAGFKDEKAQCEKASSILGKDPIILSLSILTKGEASTVIKALGAEMDEKKGKK